MKTVHFFHFETRWDEHYTDKDIDKIAPFLTHSQPDEEIYFLLSVYHKDLSRRGQFSGTPFYLSLSGDLTWDKVEEEIVVQLSRFISR